MNYIIKKYLNVVAEWKYEEIEDRFERLRKKVKIKTGKEEILDIELIKAIHHKRIEVIKDLHEQSREHYGMALLLNELNLPHIEELIESNLKVLLHKQVIGEHKTAILATTGEGDYGSCIACAKQNGRILTITEALKEMPLPHKGCNFELFKGATPFCRCCYL